MTCIRPVAIATFVVLVLGSSVVVSPVSAEARVSVNPLRALVEPGDTFTVFIWKDSVDIVFDGYETVITYDEALIEFLGADEGSVMVDTCSNRWWVVTPDTGSVFISHVLMCGGTTAEGPGALSALTFEAVAQGSTAVSTDYFWFTLGGIWIKDVDWHDGTVVVGGQSGVGETHTGCASGLSLTVRPNPASGPEVSIRCSAGADMGPGRFRLEIYDIRGRVVASPLPAAIADNGWIYLWDGRDRWGSRLAAGVYFAKIAGPGAAVSRRIVLLR